MADVSYIDVTSLDVVPDGVQNDDVLLLVRSMLMARRRAIVCQARNLKATLDVAPTM